MSIDEDSGPFVHMMGTTQWSHCPPQHLRTGLAPVCGQEGGARASGCLSPPFMWSLEQAALLKGVRSPAGGPMGWGVATGPELGVLRQGPPLWVGTGSCQECSAQHRHWLAVQDGCAREAWCPTLP